MRAWAEVSLDAVRANVRALRALVAPAEVCAVVKADGYGHGAVPVAQAALDAGATWLAVAQVAEAGSLRQFGIDAPILLLSEPQTSQIEAALDADVAITVCSVELLALLSKAVTDRGAAAWPVHLKVDTGMRRIGVAPRDAVALAKTIDADPAVELAAVWTHCAVADEPDNPFTALQLERYEAVLADLAAAAIDVPMRHVANSAAAMVQPSSRYDLVRCGIAIYGIPPAPTQRAVLDLEPAVRLATEVSFLKPVAAGEGISYGLTHHVERETVVATLPIGYADGVPRRLGIGRQEVLIGGRRYPMVGAVTMDQLMVDVGPDADMSVGDEAVLLGDQGDERITPDEWAARLGTIAYEVVCAIGPRVERRYASS